MILGLALSLSACGHFESSVSQDVSPPLELPFDSEIPLARGLDANGDGAITPRDAEWFFKLADALNDAEKVGDLHYAGLKEPRKVWDAVGFGQPAPLVAALATLSPEERYGSEGRCALRCSQPQNPGVRLSRLKSSHLRIGLARSVCRKSRCR